jgi:kynurenine formamidase
MGLESSDMSSFLRVFFALALAASVTAGCQAQDPSPERPPSPKKAPELEIKVIRNLSYDKAGGSLSRRKLDLFIPKSAEAKKWPVLIYIHGGAWVSGDKSQYSDFAESMAKRGLALAVLNYRLASSGSPHPAPLEDCARAIAWLRESAEKYSLRESRISLCGHSAGAHIAATIALNPSYLEAEGLKLNVIGAVIGLEGIYDIPQLVKTWPAYDRQFIRRAFAEPENWEKSSPQSHISAGIAAWKELSAEARWIVIHSPKDELVDPPQSANFAKALREAGAKSVEFKEDADGRHFEVIQKLEDRDCDLAELIAKSAQME